MASLSEVTKLPLGRRQGQQSRGLGIAVAHRSNPGERAAGILQSLAGRAGIIVYAGDVIERDGLKPAVSRGPQQISRLLQEIQGFHAVAQTLLRDPRPIE